MQWWGYSKEHGWVVMDRSVPTNTPGLQSDLLFFRCRDSTTYLEKRKNWEPPLYIYAPNYIRNLKPAASAEAAAEFESVKALWPEYQRQIQTEQREAKERAEAIRVEQERQQKAEESQRKAEERAKKKQLGLQS